MSLCTETPTDICSNAIPALSHVQRSVKYPVWWTPQTTYREFINALVIPYVPTVKSGTDALGYLVENGSSAVQADFNLADMQNAACTVDVSSTETYTEVVFVLGRFADLITYFTCPISALSFEILVSNWSNSQERLVAFSYGQPIKAGETIEFNLPIPMSAVNYPSWYVRMRFEKKTYASLFDVAAPNAKQAWAAVAPIVGSIFLNSECRDALMNSTSYFPLMLGVNNSYGTLTIESKDRINSWAA